MSTGHKGAPQSQAALEQKVNELVQQSRLLEAYLTDISNREATVARLIEEARLASRALQSINSPDNQESLMPLGIGIFIKAVLPPVKKLLVSVGSGVTVEKSREDTLNYVESKIKEFEVAIRQLESQRQQISMRMEQIQGQVNYLLQQSSHPSSSGESFPIK